MYSIRAIAPGMAARKFLDVAPERSKNTAHKARQTAKRALLSPQATTKWCFRTCSARAIVPGMAARKFLDVAPERSKNTAHSPDKREISSDMIERDVQAFRQMHPWEQRLVIRHRRDLLWRLDVLTATRALERDGGRQGMRRALSAEVLWEAARAVSEAPMPEVPEPPDARDAVLQRLCERLARPAPDADTQFRNDVFVHEMLVVHNRCTAGWRLGTHAPHVHLPAVRGALQQLRSDGRCAELAEVLCAVAGVVFSADDVDSVDASADCAQELAFAVPPGIGDCIPSTGTQAALDAPPRTAHARVAGVFLRDVAAMLRARQASAV